MEKIWVIEDPDENVHPQRTQCMTTEVPAPPQKNPALAYSLSLFFWGGGQIYNNQRKKGWTFLVLMLVFYTGTVLSLVFGKDILLFFSDHHISHDGVFIISELMIFCGLLFWQYNAGDAYHTAVKARREPFPGIQSRVYPFLCSLVMPGWGQFLNGQPIKGSVFSGFSLIGFFSLISASGIIVAWPALEESDTRSLIEGIFTLTVLFAPLIPFFWILSSFDALRVSIDDLKKEPLLDRIKYANNRRRTQGLIRGVFPHIKSTILLLLVLLFVVTITLYYYFPVHYYREQLTSLQAWLQKRGMTMVPELIGRLRTLLAFTPRFTL